MSIIKATAHITDVYPGSSANTFAVTVRTVHCAHSPLPIDDYLTLDNLDPDIVDAALKSDITAAVKSRWSLGLLDLVRVF